jgi:transglutaminase superfamily protein
MHRILRVVFALLALPAIARAVIRLVWLERRLPLETLVTRMRTTGRFRLAVLARPEWLLATVDRLLPLLPPRRYGLCLKRSLLLLDLWSRCGLCPRFHLGVRREGEQGRYQGHAWVSVDGAAAEPIAGSPPAAARLAPSTSSQGYPEAFVL